MTRSKDNRKINSNILPLIIPLSINSKDGIIDKNKDFRIESSFQNTIQPRQYNATRITPKTRYTVFPCLNQYPLFIKGIIRNMLKKQPNLPICSRNSTILFWYRFANLALISGRQMHCINACIFLVVLTKRRRQKTFRFCSAS